MKKIRPFLWFDSQAQQAAEFYVSIFANSRIINVAHNSEDGADPPVRSVTFDLDGQEFIALNGGPMFTFNPAISFFVSCQSQAEVDEYWEKLLVGGEPNRCGWLTDRYGLSWQIVPSVLGDLLDDPDEERSGRVMQAMLQMVKLDVAALQAARDG